MRGTAVLFAALAVCPIILSAQAADPTDEIVVESVAIEGSDAQIALRTRAGDRYDEETIQQDVRDLYAARRFSDIRVEAQNGDAGKRITFYVVESPRLMLRAVRTLPEHFRFKAEVAAGTPIDSVRAQAIASDFRRQLGEQGYPDAVVEPEIEPSGPAEADLVLHVRAAEPLRVGSVELLGETGLDRKEILRAMSLDGKRIIPGIPGIWKGWKQDAPYAPIGVASDLTRVRSLYLSRGYFDASVRLDHTSYATGKASVNLLLQPGQQYRVRRWQVSGADIDTRLGIVKGRFNAGDLCRCLLDLRRDAETEGILDFSVRLTVNPVESSTAGEVDLIATVERGQPYRIRRIELFGNKRFSDGTLRSNLLLDEMDLLDTTLLRKSLDRLNRSSLFEPLTEANVEISTDSKSGLADLRIRLKERKFGSWLLSGPVGPMSLAGPLQFTIASRLPAWGRGIFELSSWYASFNLLAYADPFARILGTGSGKTVVPIVALQRPFLPGQSWTSGLTIAPQLGWRGTLLNYGSAQLRERFLPWIGGTASAAAVLPVTVQRPTGDLMMFCEPPEPRLKWLRKGAAIALQFATSVPVF